MGRTSISSSTVAKILVHVVEPIVAESGGASGLLNLYDNILSLIESETFGRADIPDKLYNWISLKAGGAPYAAEFEKKLLSE